MMMMMTTTTIKTIKNEKRSPRKENETNISSEPFEKPKNDGSGTIIAET